MRTTINKRQDSIKLNTSTRFSGSPAHLPRQLCFPEATKEIEFAIGIAHYQNARRTQAKTIKCQNRICTFQELFSANVHSVGELTDKSVLILLLLQI